MNRKAFLAMLSCTVGFLGIGALRADSAPESLADYTAGLKTKFPDVAQISPTELEAMHPRPVLLDVRTEKEFAVSHLPSAIRAKEDSINQLKQMGIGSDAPIVVYCSVGYRSSVLAQQLQAAGFRNVRNLKGSIFAWAHAGLPLENAEGSTSGVHPYNLLWGRLLERSRWQWKP